MASYSVLFHLLFTILTTHHVTCSPTEFPSLTSLAAKTTFKQRPPIATTSDYLILVQNSNIFIDKSLLIDALFADATEKVIALLAPEKFGKTVNLRMIEYFTQISTDLQGNPSDLRNTSFYRLLQYNEIILPNGEKETLSRPLLLANNSKDTENKVNKYMGKYPTIYLGLLTLVNSTDYKSMTANLATTIGDVFRKHSYLKVVLQNWCQNRSLTTKEQTDLNSTIEEFTNYEECKAEAHDWIKSLTFLSKLLHNHFKSRVIILFDDYDVLLDILLNNNISQADRQAIHDLLSSLFTQTFEMNDFLEKAILTGRHDISKLIKLEKVTVYSTVLNETFQFSGFNYKNIFEMLDILQIPEAQLIKFYTWSDLSRFVRNSASPKYSCQSFVNFVNFANLDFIPHNTDILLENLVQNKELRKSLMNLILRGNVWVPLHHLSIDKVEVDHLNQVFSNNVTDFNTTLPILYAYLLSAGLLKPLVRDDSRHTKVVVKISNELIRMKMANSLVSFYTHRYHIPEDLLPQLIEQFDQLIEKNTTFSQDVEATMQKMVDNLPLFDEKYKAEDGEAPVDNSETDQLMRVILHTVALNLSFHYDYDIATPCEDNYYFIMLFITKRAIMIDFRIDTPVQEMIPVMSKRVIDTYMNTIEYFYRVIYVRLGNDKQINITTSVPRLKQTEFETKNKIKAARRLLKRAAMNKSCT